MLLSEFKNILKQSAPLHFALENGEAIPAHFHITEAGLVHKHFIDCGGTVRKESRISFQIWYANDTDHRLEPSKLLQIIDIAEKELPLEDFPVEIEYQQNTIGRFKLSYQTNQFVLENTFTDCLASDKCGIPADKLKVNLSTLGQESACCAPNSGCCN
jgi:hypothetical protein